METSELDSQKWFLSAKRADVMREPPCLTSLIPMSIIARKILNGTSVLHSTSDEDKCETVSDSI